MRKIVLDTNCLLMSLPKVSPYRLLWDSFLNGEIVLCITNEILWRKSFFFFKIFVDTKTLHIFANERDNQDR